MEDFTANAVSKNSSTSAINSKTPPPLPDRSKSVGDMIGSSSSSVPKKPKTPTPPAHDRGDPLGEHYAHLGKHVKEVRRRQQKTMAPPKLSDFQVKKGDTVLSTKWVEFIEAVIISISHGKMTWIIINFFFFFIFWYIVDKIYRCLGCV